MPARAQAAGSGPLMLLNDTSMLMLAPRSAAHAAGSWPLRALRDKLTFRSAVALAQLRVSMAPVSWLRASDKCCRLLQPEAHAFIMSVTAAMHAQTLHVPACTDACTAARTSWC